MKTIIYSVLLMVFCLPFTTNAQTPSAPTASVIYDCSGSSSEAILTRIDPVPTGETWYWQSSATGTSTSSSKSGVTYTRTYGSVYYLRAKNNTSGLWSTATAVTYHIKSTPNTPYSFLVNEVNNDGHTVLSTSQSLSSGQEYYWQTTSDGTSTVDSGNSITLYDGSVYYLRIQDTDTGCWSSSSPINYTVTPALPIVLPVIYNCGGSNNTATLAMGASPTNITYYWQSYSFQTSTSNSSPTVLRTSGSSYYIRAKNTVTGEWSSALQVSYFIKSKPSTPSNPSVVNNPTNVTLTRGNPPSGVTWYWQPDPNDMFMDDSNPTKTLVNSSVHYLRARDNDTGCWSDAREIHYALNPPELSLSVDYTCGSSTNTATLTRGAPPTGVTWYWQFGATLTSTSSIKAAATYELTSGSVFYIRARNNITGDWSGATAVNYHIKNKPATPSSSNISFVKNDGETILSTSQTPPSDQAFYWQTASDGITTTNSGNNSVTLTDGTTHYLRALDTETGCWGDARVISYTIKPNIPVILPVTYNCTGSSNTVTLTRDIPPTGVTWYWQSSTTGTSTTSSKSAVSYLLTSGSTYYLRAKNDANNEWSSTVQVDYEINAKPATPSSSNISITKVEGSTTLSTTQTPPSGQIYYWQTTSDGISTTSLGNSPIILTSGTSHYLRAQDNTTDCWGDAREINYSIIPTAPTTESVTVTSNCRDANDYLIGIYGINTVTLASPTPPTGITYYWQSSNSGTSTSESDQTITLNSGNKHFIRARNSAGDWSAATQIDYVIKPELATPSTSSFYITQTNNIDNTVLSTTQTAPSGQTFYWQSAVDGVDETKPATSPQTLTSGMVYYLRSQDNDLGCWGKTGTINYTITPGVPTIVSTINNCGETILTRDTPTNSEVVWYWQNAIDGVDELNSNLSVTYTNGTETYLRAYNTVSDLWSTALTINYTVNEQPAMPNMPTITYNDGETVLSNTGNAPSGTVWYWQSNIANFDTTVEASNSTISLTSGTQYFLRAHNGSSNCWSDALQINYSVENDPLPPPTPSVIVNCGTVTLTRTNPIVANEIWYWESSPSSTYTGYSAVSKDLSAGNVYYLRAYNTLLNKWSEATSVNYTLVAIPNKPTIVSKTHANGMATVTRGTPPTGIVWYWQSPYYAENMSNSSLTRTVPEGTVLYIKAYDSVTACWSSYLSVNTYENDIPAPPTLADITIIQECGKNKLTKGDAPLGILWKWVDAPTDIGGSYSSLKYVYSGTETYIRAVNVGSGEYSPALTIPYTIYNGPETPDAPIITMNSGSTILTKTGTPPTDVVWYWQSSSIGQDTSATAAENTVTHTSGTQYFLRAHNTVLDCWGEVRTIDYVVSQTPIITPIAANISTTEDCGSTTLTKVGTAPTGLSWYWQSTATGEIIDTNTSNNAVTFNSGSGTYYLRAREDVVPNTWSSALAIDYTVYQTPISPTLSDVSIVNSLGTTNISIIGTRPENVQWYWQSSDTSKEVTDSISPKILETGTSIYLRAKNTQVTDCWSAPFLINYTVDPVPVPAPNIAAITIINSGGQTTLSYDQTQVPNGDVWYWQVSNDGEGITNSNVSVVLTEGTSYYLKAQNDITKEWSAPLLINYTVNQVPAPLLAAITIINSGGQTTLSYDQTQVPNGDVWYWQVSNEGVDITNSNVSVVLTEGTSYYLKAQNDTTKEWSAPLLINYTIDPVPVPTIADITITESCGTTNFSYTKVLGIEWFWQSTAGGVITDPNAANDTIALQTGTVHYIRAQNETTLVWSDALEITYTILTNSSLWYLDSDGDGFGDATVSGNYCVPPNNYVSNEDDIDDSNVNITNITPQNYYLDQDGDGFGDPSDIELFSTKPAGRVLNNTDACPTVFGINNGCDAYTPVTLSSDQNYVYTRMYQEPMSSDAGITKFDDIIESITYFDGLGRPIQGIGINQSPLGKDIITHIGYDAFGRQDKDWLPYYEDSGDFGSYRGDVSQLTQSYYQTNYATDFVGVVNTVDINAFSQKSLEASPLNRVLQQASPGSDWRLGSGHEIAFDYQSNTVSDVKLYTVNLVFANNTYTPTLSVNTLVNNGFYAANELYKSIVKDENHDGSSTKNHTTEEFKDKQGRVVLKRTYALVGLVETTHDTYYVYDDYGNLTYVLPPLANATDNIPTLLELEDLCYQYKYDQRNRLVEKKIPGKGWEYIIYNKLDQPILTQDALQNAKLPKEWLFTKYDAFGRVAYTGLMTDSGDSSRANLQSTVDGITSQWVTKSTSSSTLAGTTIYYDNGAYPASISTIYTINYYDDYTFDEFSNLPSIIDGQSVINYNNSSKSLTKGLATGSKVRVLETNNWITTISGYDTKGRSIFTTSNNTFLGTIDVVQSTLDFVGKVDKTITTHTKGGTSIVTEDLLTYDHMGRIKKQTQELNNTNVLETIFENTYDDLGQLTSKGVGNTATTPLQTVDYKYNIRGWLKNINQDTNTDNDLFNFTIAYNNPIGGTALFNGNISQTSWNTLGVNTTSNPVLDTYTYTYDALNRITGAIGANTDHYNLDLVQYDKNGNITNLKRQGYTDVNATTFGAMDDLTYTYDNGNKLLGVSDAITTTGEGGFKDGVNSGDDFSYDINGNLLTDANKGILNIAYNHLNLPTQVTFAADKYIDYIYDATGVKIAKIVTDIGNSTTTNYAGNYIYEKQGTNTEELKFFSHAEGYVEPDGNSGYEYIYQYKDHLGNIRLSYKNIGSTSTPSLEIQEENHYYPFGLKHKGYNNVQIGRNHKYGFGGMEEQDELGLGWIDITARNYNPALGRWMNLDPLAEQMTRHSPYNYGFDNPIYFVDPDGMKPWPSINTIKEKAKQALNVVNNVVNKVGEVLDVVSRTSVNIGGEVKVTAGFQVAAQVNDNIGADVNLFNVELAGVKAEVSASSEGLENTSSAGFLGDDSNNVKTESEIAIGIGIPEVAGIGAGAKHSATTNMEKFDSETIASDTSTNFGTTTGPVSTTVTNGTNNVTGTGYTSVSTEVGAKVALLLGIEAILKVEIKVNDE